MDKKSSLFTVKREDVSEKRDQGDDDLVTLHASEQIVYLSWALISNLLLLRQTSNY